MAMGKRERDIKLLVAKFVKLVESLNPGERLTIRKVAGKPAPAKRKTAAKTTRAGKTKKRAAR